MACEDRSKQQVEQEVNSIEIIDLRTDFVSPAGNAVLKAMEESTAYPSAFGWREGEQLQKLEKRLATLLGKEDSLFFPTCTMANLAAIMLQATRGDTVLAESESHIATTERTGLASVAGITVHGLAGRAGVMGLDAMEEEISTRLTSQRQGIDLIALENTHNRAGGMPLPLNYVKDIAVLAYRYKALVHLDGSRLFNAAIAGNVELVQLADGADTVAVSLNKGLGAPYGAILAGSAELVQRAVILRQQLGGGMRPLGMLAAAADIALDRMNDLAGDHSLARKIAEIIADISGYEVDVEMTLTNIVMVKLSLDLAATEIFAKRMAAHGILVMVMGEGRIRLCVHRGLTEGMLGQIEQAFRSVAQSTFYGDNYMRSSGAKAQNYGESRK